MLTPNPTPADSLARQELAALETGTKVISWGVYYHHFHDSQRLLMFSPG